MRITKNQRGNAFVIVVVILVIVAVIVLGLWAVFSTKERSEKILNEKGPIQTKEEKQQ